MLRPLQKKDKIRDCVLNKTFWTVILSTIVLITGVFFLFGKSPKNDEVVFWTLQMNDFAPYINGVIEEFEAQNPDIKIKWVDVPLPLC